MGTTYPAGQGFLTQIATDMKGFETVGKSLYRTGRAKILEWLEQQNKIHVCGTSLGGALSGLLAIDIGTLGNKISRYDLLNPAGIHDALSKSRFDHWDEFSEHPDVVVQKQGNDLVSSFGLWKKEWTVVAVTPPNGRQGPNSLWDHALNYTGLKGTRFSYIDTAADNAKRNRRNFWLYSLGRGIIYYGFLVPYIFVLRPFTYFLVENLAPLLFLASLILLLNVAAVSMISGLIVATAIACLLISATMILLKIFNHFFLEKNSISSDVALHSVPKMHDPSLVRNPTMDIYHHDNTVNIELTYREINSYYRIMRCSVKKKEFLSVDDSPSKYVEGVAKRALLELSEDKEQSDEVLSFRVTKAKAAHIRHTLTLIEKLRDENETKLVALVGDSYKRYCFGKQILLSK